MRVAVMTCLLAATTATAAAADQWSVVVKTQQGETIRGQLLAMTPERLTISRGGRLEPIPLDDVVQVVKPRDSVLDGLLKGVLIGLIPIIIWGQDADAGFAARYVLSYAVIGMGVDALQGDRVVLYDRRTGAGPPPAASAKLGWKVRF